MSLKTSRAEFLHTLWTHSTRSGFGGRSASKEKQPSANERLDRSYPVGVEDSEPQGLRSKVGDRYEVEAKLDGHVTLTPKLTWAAAKTRLGVNDSPAGEFDKLFGDLPTGPF